MLVEINCNMQPLTLEVIGNDCTINCVGEIALNGSTVDIGFYPNVSFNGDPLLESRVAALETAINDFDTQQLCDAFGTIVLNNI